MERYSGGVRPYFLACSKNESRPPAVKEQPCRAIRSQWVKRKGARPSLVSPCLSHFLRQLERLWKGGLVASGQVSHLVRGLAIA